MAGDLTRRHLLAAAVVVGFDLSTRSWVRAAEAATRSDFEGVPRLDGRLLFDDASREAVRTDQGNIVFGTPAAVLEPGSVHDVQAMVAFCAERGIPVAARGEGHTTHGQSLAPGGLTIVMATLGGIERVGVDGAVVAGGTTWAEVTRAALPLGLTPPTLTGYLGLSVGGTLAVGGVSAAIGSGLQIDRVQQLEVVDGRGELHRCSATRNRKLFDAVRGGVGQYGVVTRAWLDLERTPPWVRRWQIPYTSVEACFADWQVLLDRAEVWEAYLEWLPGQALLPTLYVTQRFDPAAGPGPDGRHLLRGLSPHAALVPAQDATFEDHVFRVDAQVGMLERTGWSAYEKPWFDVWLPRSRVAGYVAEVVPEVGLDEVAAGFVLCFAKRRSQLTNPTFPYPENDGEDWVYLFDILGASPVPGSGAAGLARNRERFERAREAGGTRYPIGALEFSRDDWRRQYGERRYEALRAVKRRHDPAGILGGGIAMFG